MTGPAAGNGSRPESFDLDAAVAAAEADTEQFLFTDHGNEYTVPPQSEWPLTAFGALARGDLEAALRDLLGDEQWERLAPGFTLGRMDVLFTHMAQQAGFTLPNSGRLQRRDLIPR